MSFIKPKVNHTVHKVVAKVPVIMQLEALECGTASLAMIMAYYGKWVPLEQVRADCGKSTLSKLISGLYVPWKGDILFDGKPRSAFHRSVMTGSVAVVDQDIILFEDTIANNIKMWDDSIKDYEMLLAARDAQLHEDIMQRDGGYRYKITAGGRDLSGGQRQRLEIARVLAQDPSIIIQDEATSALDAKTEYDVVNAIKERGITCIVIAHRLSTIRDCDEIIEFVNNT